MRILLVTDWLRVPGGVEGYVAFLRQALRDSGDDARLLTSGAGSAADGTADYVAYGTNRLAAQAFLQIVNPRALADVEAAVRDFRPDVVHVHMFENHLSPAILLSCRHTPVVLSIADLKMICPTNSKLFPDGSLCSVRAGFACVGHGCVSLPQWIRNKPRYALIRSWPARVNRVLSCSAGLQRLLAEHGVTSEHVPMPVSLPPTSFFRAPSETPVFMYCGRLAREKGLEFLLRAFARFHSAMPTASLSIVGDGPLRASLRELAASLTLADTVTWKGWLSQREIEPEWSRAWALVAPSLWAEPFGLVAAEAIVRGVPVLASATGGFSETVEPHESGLLFPNGDKDALVASLTRVATSEVFPSHIVSERARRSIAVRHAPQEHLQRLRAIYRAAIDDRRQAAELATRQ